MARPASAGPSCDLSTLMLTPSVSPTVLGARDGTRHTDRVTTSSPPVVGLLLAAGAGRRMGRPKALVPGTDGRPQVVAAVGVLLEGGCPEVLVVTGAAGAEVSELVLSTPARAASSGTVRTVACARWEEGMGASLRTGLDAVGGGPAAVLVHLVDLPDVGPDVLRRVLDALPDEAPERVLARAAYRGVPGHPVLLGRAHWRGVAGVATGDRGARDYLREHAPVLVECADLASGRDVDTPADLDRAVTPHDPLG